jgi:peptidoglycan hydrolase CwlO-like protein
VDNFLLVGILGVLALYFYSSMSIYKSMYRKVIEEKNMADTSIASLKKMINRYEVQVQDTIETINNSQDSLQVARDDLQKTKLLNSDLEHRNRLLQERVNELYASVGAV